MPVNEPYYCSTAEVIDAGVTVSQCIDLHDELWPLEIREKDLIIIYKYSYCDLSLSEAVSHFRTMCII